MCFLSISFSFKLEISCILFSTPLPLKLDLIKSQLTFQLPGLTTQISICISKYFNLPDPLFQVIFLDTIN